jgi:pSer/pThr/pTyr-binding forkhead associated (FHA) protein
MAQLFVLSGPDVGKSFDVKSGDTIGRSPECIVTVRDSSVSRKHARLEREGEAWYVVDEGSRNGVSVDGARTERAAIVDKQEFLLGELLLRFREDEPDAAAPTPVTAPPAPAPAPPVRPAPAPTQASPPDEGDDEDEILLEDPDEIEIEAAQAPSELARTTLASRPDPVARAHDAGFGAGGGGAAGNQLSRGPASAGDRILQYSKVSGGGTFSTSELAQYPLWVRLGVLLVGLALAAGIAWVAFHGSSFVKKQVSGGEVQQGD